MENSTSINGSSSDRLPPVYSSARRYHYQQPTKPRTNTEMSSTFNRLYYTQIHEKGNTAPTGRSGTKEGVKEGGELAQQKASSSRVRRPYGEPLPPTSVIHAEQADALVSRLSKIPKRMIYAASTPVQPTHASTVVLGPIDNQKPDDYDAKKDVHLSLFWARQEVLRQHQMHERELSSSRRRNRSSQQRTRKSDHRKEEHDDDEDLRKAPVMPATDSGESEPKKREAKPSSPASPKQKESEPKKKQEEEEKGASPPTSPKQKESEPKEEEEEKDAASPTSPNKEKEPTTDATLESKTKAREGEEEEDAARTPKETKGEATDEGGGDGADDAAGAVGAVSPSDDYANDSYEEASPSPPRDSARTEDSYQSAEGQQ